MFGQSLHLKPASLLIGFPIPKSRQRRYECLTSSLPMCSLIGGTSETAVTFAGRGTQSYINVGVSSQSTHLAKERQRALLFECIADYFVINIKITHVLVPFAIE